MSDDAASRAGHDAPVLVLTIDQRRSRSTSDRVPQMLQRLAALPMRRPFQRTAGDEFQGVLSDPDSLAPVLEPMLRDGGWHVGVGAGQVTRPLPRDARSGSGPAYLHAREAVTAAKTSPWRLRVVAEDTTGRPLESALWLWAALLARRTEGGWEVADLVDQGLSYDEAGRRLGISQSAVSQRARSAGIAEGRRARELVTHLAAELLGVSR